MCDADLMIPNRGRIGDPPLLLRRDEHRTWKGHRTKNDIFTKNEITKNEMENQIFIRCSLVREISVRKKIFFGKFSNLKKKSVEKKNSEKSVAKKKSSDEKNFLKIENAFSQKLCLAC